MKTLRFSLVIVFIFLRISLLFGQNTIYGSGAGSSLTSGTGNTFIGHQSGNATTSGSYNTFLGVVSGKANTSGYATIAIGFASGILTKTGTKNTFMGVYSGYANDSGEKNVYLGYRAGFASQYDFKNVFIGNDAGYKNKGGDWNVFVGSEAGFNNSTGHSNVFIGEGTGLTNTTGRFNTFVGAQSGKSSTTAYGNTFIGSYSGNKNTIGENNAFLGSSTGYNNTTGDNNTFLGELSGYQNQTGAGNVFIGYAAGYTETGSNRLYINNGSGIPLIYGNFSNNTVSIQYKYNGTAYMLYVPGDVYASSVFSPSDERFKKNIKEVQSALGKVKSLKGVTYEFKNERSEARQFPKGNQYGLLAQEVKEILPDLVTEDEEGYMAVNYTGLIPVLIEAIKELSVGTDSMQNYQAQISALHLENIAIREELSALKAALQNTSGNINREFSNTSVLYQNSPNPFSNTTRIKYSLSEDVQAASVYIYDLQGNQVIHFNILSPGDGEVDILGSSLQPGMYFYSLIADGRLVDTKRMILTQ